jgi:hypothetical protein
VKILLDHDLPKALRLKLVGHLALTARQMQWDALSNGRLLAMADINGFDVLLTADRKMYAQNRYVARRISLVVLTRSEMVYLEPMIKTILAVIQRAAPGSYEEIKIPIAPKVRKEHGGV